jgi:tetratricopeptide (TPR) repeat protein
MQVRSPLSFIGPRFTERILIELGVGSGSEPATQGLQRTDAELLKATLVRLQLLLVAAELTSVAERGASSSRRELGLPDTQLEDECRIGRRRRGAHEAERRPGLGCGRRRFARERASESARGDRGARQDPDRGDEPYVRAPIMEAVEAEWLAHRRRSIAARLSAAGCWIRPLGLSGRRHVMLGHVIRRAQHGRRAVLLAALLAGCARTTSTSIPDERPADRSPTRAESNAAAELADADPSAWLDEAERALDRGEPARAATLFARYLGHSFETTGPSQEVDGDARRAYRGLARAHEQLGDFDAAIRAYDAFLARYPDDGDAPGMLSRRGACEAEVGEWERSSVSFAGVLAAGGEALLPSQKVEALTRRGFALYQLERFAEADEVFAEADAIFEAATQGGLERFSDTYFVGMARFYRAAILHVEFRRVRIRLPEAQMSADFEAKLALLERAQDAYNHVVRARHVFWVSAAGFQLGSLFEEFHDAIMYAPAPDWLDDSQRRTYYRELEQQLRPVIDKAVWVFEKNLETARKLGYENDFIDRTEAALAHLQAVLLGREDPGQPVPRLAPREPSSDDLDTLTPTEDLPAAERKLFVPLPTTL